MADIPSLVATSISRMEVL